MAKYGKKTQEKIGKVMREYKHGQLKHAKSRKQAVAIGLSEARRAGGKVPLRPKRGGKK